MAKKKPTAANTYRRIEVSGKLLPRIGVVAGKGMIERIWPEHRVIKRGSDVLRMNCPVHHDPTPSCDLNFVTGSIYCFGCKFRTKSLFEFLQRGKGWSYKAALDTIRQYVDLRTISETTAKEIHTLDVWQSAQAFVMEAFNEHLQRLLAPGQRPEYTQALRETAQPTLDWLFEHRRRDRALVSEMPYGVVPPAHLIEPMLKDLIDNREVDRRVARGLKYPEPEWRAEVLQQALAIYRGVDSSFVHAVSFHSGHNFTTPGRIKLRRPSDNKAENTAVLPGRTEDEPLGFFGLYRPHLVGRANLDVDSFRFLLVEGENDALALMEGLEREGRSGVVALGLGGVSNEIDQLAEAEVSQVWLISDDPGHGGTDFARGCLRTAYEVDVRVFKRWDRILRSYPQVKDPDDLVKVAGFDYAYQVFVDTPDNYALTSEWVYDQIQAELATREIAEGDVRAVTDVVSVYGPCVRHPATQARFIDMVAAMTRIAPGELRKSIVLGQSNTEAAFKAQLIECLRREFHTVYCTQSPRSPVLRLFHKEKRVAVEFPINDGEAFALAIARIHGSVYEFVRDQVGLALFNEDDGAPNTTPELSALPKIYNYLKLAAQELVRGVPLRTDCEEYGQGGHWLPDPDRPGEHALYVNNGTRVYKGCYPVGGGARLDWRELSGPSDGMHLFRTARVAWSREIVSAQDLVAGNEITKRQLHEQIEKVADMIDIGWRLAHQEVDCTYVAYYLAAAAISFIWPIKNITAIHGETSSGKSTLLSMFCGGTHPALQMLEMSTYVDLFTQAAIYQRFSRSSLLLGFDELEEDGDTTQKHSVEVVGLIRMMRSVIGEGGATIYRGSIRGEDAPDYLIRTPIAFASINRAKRPEDDNRRMDIETRKVTTEKIADPAQAIFQRYTPDDVRAVRRTLTLGMPKLAAEFLEHYAAIRTKINVSQVVPFKVPVRYLNNYLPVCAMMALLGLDWQAFLVKSCELRRTRLDTLAGETSASTIYERLFRVANVHPLENDRSTVKRVMDMLATDAMIDDLNRTRCGVSVLRDRGLAIIDWITCQSKGGVLEGWTEYRNAPHRTLKHLFDQHPRAMRTEEYEHYGIPRAVRVMGSGYNPSTISVIDIKELIDEIRSEAPADPAASAPRDRRPTTTGAHDNAESNNI